MAKQNSLLSDWIETVHYFGKGWDGLDAIPDRDGQPGWDTPASAADPDDEEESDAGRPPKLQSRLAKCGGPGSGKPGPCPEGGGDDSTSKPHKLDAAKLPGNIAEVHAQAGTKADGILSRIAAMPKKAVAYGVNKAKALYSKMEEKYGPRWAKAIVTVGVVTFPTPFTTGAVMATVGLAMLSKKLLGSGAKAEGEPEIAKVFKLAEEFTRELVKSLEGVELSEEERAAIEGIIREEKNGSL